ncbi:hypothetical protein DFJ74DRAFT_705155 [Hyaloraphidium curvatum]|nr:hypothetical protein DFJ74DRAFT_705155 [Hyaloraphidium curvatum]
MVLATLLAILVALGVASAQSPTPTTPGTTPTAAAGGDLFSTLPFGQFVTGGSFSGFGGEFKYWGVQMFYPGGDPDLLDTHIVAQTTLGGTNYSEYQGTAERTNSSGISILYAGPNLENMTCIKSNAAPGAISCEFSGSVGQTGSYTGSGISYPVSYALGIVNGTASGNATSTGTAGASSTGGASSAGSASPTATSTLTVGSSRQAQTPNIINKTDISTSFIVQGSTIQYGAFEAVIWVSDSPADGVVDPSAVIVQMEATHPADRSIYEFYSGIGLPVNASAWRFTMAGSTSSELIVTPIQSTAHGPILHGTLSGTFQGAVYNGTATAYPTRYVLQELGLSTGRRMEKRMRRVFGGN